jgi:hypothetical protein
MSCAINWVVAATVAMACGAAMAEPVNCPASLKSRPWRNVEICEGPPSEKVLLRQDEYAGGEWPVAVWKFEAGGKQRIWVVCGYRNTYDTMEFELPEETRRCEVRFRRTVPEGVDCS